MSIHRGRGLALNLPNNPLSIPFPSPSTQTPTPKPNSDSKSIPAIVNQKQSVPKLLHYKPFPRNSVNLVTGPTSVGKTRFITHLFNHYPTYFQSPVHRILVVQCNDRIKPIKFDLVSSALDGEEDYNELLIEHVTLANFSPEELRSGDLVVIDDVQKVTDTIRMSISVCAHHYDLVSLFIVTHSVLGHVHFELLSLVHRALLFMKSTSNIRLLKYIGAHFYPDPELKNVLNEMASFCHKLQEVLCVELSPKGDDESTVPLMGSSHLMSLTEHNGFCLVYPQPYGGMEYTSTFNRSDSDNFSITQTSNENMSNILYIDGLPKYTLVALPVDVVKRNVRKPTDTDPTHSKCTEEDEWNETSEHIEELIEAYFKPRRWRDCKNVAAELLRDRRLCIYKDGRYFHFKGKPKQVISMLDFLHQVTRQVGHKEVPPEMTTQLKLYKKCVENLRNRGIPLSVLKNKFLH